MNIDKFLIKISLRRKMLWVSLTAFLPVVIMIGGMVFYIHSLMHSRDEIALAQQVGMVRSFGRQFSYTVEKAYGQVLSAIDTTNDNLDNDLKNITEQEQFIDNVYLADERGMVIASSAYIGDRVSLPNPLFTWIESKTEWGVLITEEEDIMNQEISIMSSYFNDSNDLLFFIVMILNPIAILDAFITNNYSLNSGDYGSKILFNYTVDYRDSTHRTRLVTIGHDKKPLDNGGLFIENANAAINFDKRHLVQEEPFWQGGDSLLIFSVYKPMLTMADVLHSMGWILILGMVGCGVIALALSWITMHHVVFSDVEDVVHTMKAIESGQLSRRSHVVRNDVIGVIAMNINQMAVAIERQTHELEAISRTDALTKVHNRMYFMKRLQQLVEDDPSGAWREGHIIMIDIDHFKQINDTHGHLVGDNTLQEVARLCNLSLVEIKHIFARFGGEEFIVFIYHESVPNVVKWAVNIKETIKAYPFANEKKDNCFAVTISLGVTSCRTGTLKDCINRADNALYDAKHAGRNRIKLW